MSYVSYNSQKIIPAPLVNIRREWIRTEDGSRAGQRLLITLTGSFVSGKGGLYDGSGYPPDVPAKRHCFSDILDKQDELQDLFNNTDYAWFEIMPDPEDTATPTKYIAKVVSTDFPEDLWVETCEYTVELEAQIANTTNDYEVVSDYDENWELRYNETPDNTYTLTHNVQCTSREQYIVAISSIRNGWIKAYDYVNGVLGGTGIDNTIVQGDPGFALSASFDGYNHVLTQNIDEYSGVYNISETWLMCTNPYTEEQQVDVRWERDTPESEPDTSVTVSGTITGLRQDDGSGYADASARWAVVEPTLYSTANSATPGVTLIQTPKSTQVTTDEINRVINYSYVYDNGSTDYRHNQTSTVTTGDGDCNRITVVVSGVVTGIKDESSTPAVTAWDNAIAQWPTIKTALPTDASDAYTVFGGSGSLRTGTVNKREIYDEYLGTISYEYTYHDWSTAYIHEQTITSAYNKVEDRGNVSVSGTITAWCADGYGAAVGALPTAAQAYTTGLSYYSGTGTLSSDPVSSNIAYNEYRRQVTYTYDFDDKDNDADEDITYTVRNDPAQCGYQLGTIAGTIIGKGTGSVDRYTNAETVFNSTYYTADPSLISDYLPGAKFVTKSVSYNEFNGRISFTYEYSNQANSYMIDETITTNYDPGDCGYATLTQSGTVTGYCTGGSGTAIANADAGLLTVSAPAGAGTRVRSSVARNENQGTISYTYEYSERASPYTIDSTMSETERLDQRGKTRVYSGTVNGTCTGNPPTPGTKYANAVAGWASHEPTLNPGSNWVRLSKTVGHNEFQGIITFNIEYREKSSCVTNAIEESITITNEYPTDIFAIVAILGGPSNIQDKDGTTVARKTISIDVRGEPNTTCALDNSTFDVETLIDSAAPSADVVVVERNTDSWNPRTGTYNRTKAWVYANCS
jgi:hypothetical protein